VPTSSLLAGLTESRALDPTLVGSKAANLALVLRAGFPAPDGLVLTTEAFDQFAAQADGAGQDLPGSLMQALQEIIERFGDIMLAVRSSAVAEDLPGAAFAGQYETVLDVRGLAALQSAVLRCWASLDLASVAAYRARSGLRRRGAMAVLIQPMVRSDTAGVALGTNPITGDRADVLVSATRGTGAALVSGEVIAEEWAVSAVRATCSAPSAGVLTADQAMQVARLLRDVEPILCQGPLDMEWAIETGQVIVLQARPMTAIPVQVTWPPPAGRAWFRSIRLGEWLPEPVTPLFESWLLEHAEERFRQRQAADGGVRVPAPMHVCVHGWYFSSPLGSGSQAALLGGWLRCPRLAAATVLAPRWPGVADSLFYGTQASTWTNAVLQPYRNLVAECERDLGDAGLANVVAMVDRIADAVGDFVWSLVLCGGAAWRFEIALGRFFRRHLSSAVDGPYQVLLSGMSAAGTPPHAVHSLDWIRETVGELAAVAPQQGHRASRNEDAVAARQQFETACRTALSGRRRQLARFNHLLEIAQRYSVTRAEQSYWFTLAWPVLRQCLNRLGTQLADAGMLDHPADVFFISRAELDDCLSGAPPADLPDSVRDRRETWARQRRMSPPLVLGKAPFLLDKLLSAPESRRTEPEASAVSMRGTPASPGSASGPVRVLRDLAEIPAVRSGEVLVVSAAVPALTVVFDRIAALCADAGSVASHASLVAREYGIPAVTGLGDATARLSNQVWVRVDGSAGFVEIS